MLDFVGKRRKVTVVNPHAVKPDAGEARTSSRARHDSQNVFWRKSWRFGLRLGRRLGCRLRRGSGCRLVFSLWLCFGSCRSGLFDGLG